MGMSSSSSAEVVVVDVVVAGGGREVGVGGFEVIVTSQIDSYRASMRTVVLIRVILELILRVYELHSGDTLPTLKKQRLRV